MSFVGKKFPNLSIDAMDAMGIPMKINVFEEAVKNKSKVLLFWYPKDFTFVCPTELHAFQAALSEFEKRNTKVIAASCDSNEVHFAWLTKPKNHGGIQGVTYPIIADTHRHLSAILGILDQEVAFDENTGEEVYMGDNVSYRATYLIDEEGKVFHESINDMPLGRNVAEYLRLLDAYQHVQEFGEVCPANWQQGDMAFHADPEGVADYLSVN